MKIFLSFILIASSFAGWSQPKTRFDEVAYKFLKDFFQAKSQRLYSGTINTRGKVLMMGPAILAYRFPKKFQFSYLGATPVGVTIEDDKVFDLSYPNGVQKAPVKTENKKIEGMAIKYLVDAFVNLSESKIKKFLLLNAFNWKVTVVKGETSILMTSLGDIYSIKNILFDFDKDRNLKRFKLTDAENTEYNFVVYEVKNLLEVKNLVEVKKLLEDKDLTDIRAKKAAKETSKKPVKK